MANPYGLSWQTRLLLWLLSTRPDVVGVNLLTPADHLQRCMNASRR
jgi:hypothetical protein